MEQLNAPPPSLPPDLGAVLDAQPWWYIAAGAGGFVALVLLIGWLVYGATGMYRVRTIDGKRSLVKGWRREVQTLPFGEPLIRRSERRREPTMRVAVLERPAPPHAWRDAQNYMRVRS